MNNWYTDLMTVYRRENYTDGNLTKQRRVLVKENIPCRIYRSSNPQTKFTTTYPSVTNNDMLACSTNEDIRAGDEIRVTRGARITGTGNTTQYYAGDPTDYFEPFGGRRPRLDHKQVPLGGEKKLNQGVERNGL